MKYAILILIAFALLSAAVVSTVTVDRRPPITAFVRSEALDQPSTVGLPTAVRLYREKVRDDCPVASHRWAIDSEGAVWDIPDRVWEGGSAHVAYVDLVIDTTALPVGIYDLYFAAGYKCPGNWIVEGKVFTYSVGSIRIRIE